MICLQQLGSQANENKKGSLLAKTMLVTQKEVGGKKGICPMKVITAGPHAYSAHKEGAASAMVSSMLCCFIYPHYNVNRPTSSLGWPFNALFSYILLLIFDAEQQKQVGGNEGLCPIKVIKAGLHAEWVAKEVMNVITADPHVEWVSKEGVTTSKMVRCSIYVTLNCCLLHDHSINWS